MEDCSILLYVFSHLLEHTSSKLINYQVSVAMMVVGAVPYVRGGLVIIAQILGAIAASAVVYGLLPGPLNVRTGLGGDTTVVQGLFIEVKSTFPFPLTISKI